MASAKQSLGIPLQQIADRGFAVTSSLASYSTNWNINDLVSKTSLSSSLLSEIARALNQNEEYFKPGFWEKFDKVATKCSNEYEVLRAGLEKAHSCKKDDLTEDGKKPPKKAWPRLVWALGMEERGDKAVWRFADKMDESIQQVLMLQSVVMLVVLQSHAKERALTPSEQTDLCRLKRNMGKLFEALHEAEIASVIALGLTEVSKTINVEQALKNANIDDNVDDKASIAASMTSNATSVTVRNPPEEEAPVIIKKPAIVPAQFPPGLSGPPSSPPPPSPPQIRNANTDVFEMYRASFVGRPNNKVKSTFRFLGIPFTVQREDTEVESHHERMPATQDEIKAFIRKTNANKPANVLSNFDSLLNIPPATNTGVYKIINDKMYNKGPNRYLWTLECLVPMIWTDVVRKGRFGRKKPGEKTNGYVVVLRGHIGFPPPPPFRGPPCPPGPPPNMKPVENVAKKPEVKKPAARIDLTQRETEIVVNDFLATFSTLYDGVAVEDRGKALKTIDLSQEEYDDDSSSISSSSSGSLVDD